jgi:hypothetical protein
MKVTYIEKGRPFDFKRIDTVRTVYFERTWKSGGLLYGYTDRFNVMSIAIEDIVEMQDEI